MSIKYKIDFSNEKDNKLWFYEAYQGNKRIEYAYIEYKSNDIVYYSADDDIEHIFPKKDINSFLLFLFNNIAFKATKSRVDLKNKFSKPYYNVRILAKNLPLIHLVFIYYGNILKALSSLGIVYKIDKNKAPNIKQDSLFYPISIKLADNKYLNIFPKNNYEQYMINGLSIFSFKKALTSSELTSEEAIYRWYTNAKDYGSFIRKVKDLFNEFIDTTTAKLLKIYNYPNNFIEIVAKVMPQMILNAPVAKTNDLNNYRLRMSETIAHAGYKEILQAAKTLKLNKNIPNARLRIQKDAIIKQLQSTGMMQYTRTVNPLEELLLSAKVTKAGVGNPKKEQITLDKRDLNPSYFGTISPTTTNEYGGIGLNQTLTNKATIKDRFGTIQVKEFTNESNSFDNLSFSESLTPFFEYDDTTRRVMGNQQFSQFIQIDNPDVPLVQTGFESYIPFIVSDKFAIKAKKPGRVEVKKTHLIMHYNDGTEEIFSLTPAKARTKRGAYLPLAYNVLVKDNQKVKKGEILAVTNSLKYGKLAVGKNLVVAEMGYRGMNFEDGWVVTEDINEKFKSKIYEKLTIVIPPNAEISKLNINKNKNTRPGEVLIEYYLDKQEMDKLDELEDTIETSGNEEDKADDIAVGKEIIGNKVIYRSIGGPIVDYVIKLNTKKMDSKLLAKWKEQVADIKSKLKICNKLSGIEKLNCRDQIQFLESLEIGGHKIAGNEVEGAILEIFIEKENPIRYGSKFTLMSSGGKGTVQYIIPKDKKPIAVESGLEIDFIATPMSLISRKNPSIVLMMYSGKIAYFINKKVQELILSGNINEAKKILLDVFDVLDKTKNKIIYKELKAFLENSSEFLKKYIQNHDPLKNPAFPIIVPPYKNKIKIKDLEEVAKKYNIPLDEPVYVPEEGTTTKSKVQVGILPVYLLEHFPKEMSSVRGIINTKKQITTGQGRSGTKEGNGAIALGLYDLFSIGSRNADILLKELWVLKTDAQKSKKKLISKIIKGEKPSLNSIEIDEDDLVAKQMIKAYFYGALLEPKF